MAVLCKGNVKHHIIETPTSTAVGLVGTGQFCEARNCNYLGFESYDLNQRVKSILQRQLFIIFELSIIRYLIDIKIKFGDNKLNKKITSLRNDGWLNVSFGNFSIDMKEVEIYKANPKFLWRFSVNNYNYFKLRFEDNFDMIEQTFLITNDYDYSPIVGFLSDYRNMSFKIFHMSHYFKEATIECIKSLIKSLLENQLNYYEKLEFKYCDDFYLHQASIDIEYENFVILLITGFYDFDKPGNLILERQKIIDEKIKHNQMKRKDMKRINEINLFKNEFLITCPLNALPYLGDYCNTESRLFFCQVKYFQEMIINYKLEMVEREIFIETDWNHKYLLKQTEYPYSFYSFVYSILGDIVNINDGKYLFKDENKRLKIRGPWYLPCNLNQEINCLLKFIMQNNFFNDFNINMKEMSKQIKMDIFIQPFKCLKEKDWRNEISFRDHKIYYIELEDKIHNLKLFKHCDKDLSKYFSAILSLYGYDNNSKYLDHRPSLYKFMELYEKKMHVLENNKHNVSRDLDIDIGVDTDNENNEDSISYPINTSHKGWKLLDKNTNDKTSRLPFKVLTNYKERWKNVNFQT